MTNQTKHTPGPWRSLPTGKPNQTAVLAHLMTVCRIEAGSNSEREANAALIAAAPELLEALKTIEKAFVESPGTFNYSQYEDVVVAAIAKAEGKS